jgi:predicted ATP-grasp superfamily ATP-dependent carboligase
LEFGRASTYVETVNRPEIEEPARRLLSEIGFTGLVEVEFKQDPRTGCYKVLDINARVWGWHTLGDRAGVDFSYLLWRMVHGETVQEAKGRAGVRWIRMLTDLPAVARQVRAGTLSLRDYLGSFRRPMEFAVFAFDDPLPALVEVPLLVRITWKRGAI